MGALIAEIELMKRYDRPLPRYTSYPTAPHFDAAFGAKQFLEHALRSNATTRQPSLSLYVHVPYCLSPCFYCGCNRIITRDSAQGEAYVKALLVETALVSDLLDQDREVGQLHLGGGTPNFLSPQALARLLDGIAEHFTLSGAPERDFSIELDPRFVAGDFIETGAQLGLNRVSLGVQDFDPGVQSAINRRQSFEQTRRVVEESREAGIRSINIDLICGLPRQNPSGFARTLEYVMQLRPERIALYTYAHHPELFKAQRQIDSHELPDAPARLALQQVAIELLTAEGYEYIGMDHFALPADDLAVAHSEGTLQRNFMGYTTHAECDLIGLGMSAISSVGESFSQNHRSVSDWRLALEQGHLPTWRGIALSADDRLRRDVIQQVMCRGEIAIAEIELRHGIVFRDYFTAALSKLGPLESDGLITFGTDGIRATPSGRLFLRNIAACFDRYL